MGIDVWRESSVSSIGSDVVTGADRMCRRVRRRWRQHYYDDSRNHDIDVVDDLLDHHHHHS
ncbi:MAG: hypothetical protein WBZ45_08310, partial [Acidimicrobiia bacterium]